MNPDLSWLIGDTIERVEYDEQTQEWVFAIGQCSVLRIECLWRITNGRKLLVARGDHGQQYGLTAPIDAASKAMGILAERRIVDVVLAEVSPDLSIELDGAIKLRTFADSTGYEAWALMGPSGTVLIGQGGGNIILYPGDPIA